MGKKSLNLDKLPGVRDTITFILHEKEYEVKPLEDSDLSAVLEVEEQAPESMTMGTIHAKQLALLTGAPEEDFISMPERVVLIGQTAAALGFVMESLNTETRKQRRRQQRGR